jgi:hypothetical protein
MGSNTNATVRYVRYPAGKPDGYSKLALVQKSSSFLAKSCMYIPCEHVVAMISCHMWGQGMSVAVMCCRKLHTLIDIPSFTYSVKFT